MCDEWMSSLALPLTQEQFRLLPRSPAFRYTHHEGVAWLNPRPRYFHAILELTVAPVMVADVALRPVRLEDWEDMEPVFAAAFSGQPPFCGLDNSTRLQAACKSLTQTRTGGDGPWIGQASFVALDKPEGQIVGAALVTLLPQGDPTSGDSYHWAEPPPPHAVTLGLGRPHLTWIFVEPRDVGRGVGTALLAAVADSLRGLGYQELASTFLLGNDSSMLWHWRCGFRLLSHPGSRRREGGGDGCLQTV
jgi:GNAT superfamily N-acetyltransferase